MRLTKETNLYRDHAVKNGVDDAAKVATNYLDYDQQTGLSVGYIGSSERAVITSDGMEIYDGFNDQIAQFKAVTRLGLAGGANLRLDYHSLQLQDIDGNTYVHLSDLRDTTGYATVNEDIIATGTSQTTFSLSYDVTSANNILSVKVNNVQTTAYTFYRPSASSRYISLNTAPSVDSIVSVSYKTQEVYRAYTFGNRANSNVGNESFVHGSACIASGKNSFASGYQCQATEEESHAEGFQCVAKGKYAHAEGDRCNAFSDSSHAEGIQCNAGTENQSYNTMGSHAEGIQCSAAGRYSHAEGSNCASNGYYSHAEGYHCTSNGNNSHAEGYYSEASGGSHTEGYYTSSTAQYGHAEGKSSSVTGNYAHAEGESCTATGASSHAEGYNCSATAQYAHAEGNGCTSQGGHAEGNGCVSKGGHAEGYQCTTNAMHSHAEGYKCETTSSASYSHAEGHNCKTSQSYSHAEGSGCEATSYYAHAEGVNCKAQYEGSHAEGIGTIANDYYQHVSGKYNVANSPLGSYIFKVGGGHETSGTITRKDALTLSTSGNMTIAGTLTQQSDKRLKHHRAYLSDQQDQVNEFVNRLKPAWFEKDEQKHLGFYAQDVQQTDRWQCMVDNDTNGYLTLGYTEILAPLVAYCQNLEQKVETLEQRIARLEQLLNQQ